MAISEWPNLAGCLAYLIPCWNSQVVRGSSHVGRINHGRFGGQTGADLQRVSDIKQVLPVDHVVLDPGDVAFFHCNLLHKSNKNRSPRRRWAMLCAYNRASNDPVIEHHCPQYTPLLKVSGYRKVQASQWRRWPVTVVLVHVQVPDSAVLDCSTNDTAGKEFMNPQDDKTVEVKSWVSLTLWVYDTWIFVIVITVQRWYCFSSLFSYILHLFYHVKQATLIIGGLGSGDCLVLDAEICVSDHARREVRIQNPSGNARVQETEYLTEKGLLDCRMFSVLSSLALVLNTFTNHGTSMWQLSHCNSLHVFRDNVDRRLLHAWRIAVKI